MTPVPRPPARLTALRLIAPGALLLCHCSDARLAPDMARSQQAIESGELDTVHDSVFRVITRAGGSNALCSATLIAPNLMLTARHCVAEIPDTQVDCDTDRFLATSNPAELLFANDTEPTLLSRWYAARDVLVNEASDAFCGNDVGLVILEGNVPQAAATPSAVRLEPIVVEDEPYIAVGYGGDMGDESATYGVRHFRSDSKVNCVGRACGPSVTEAEFGGSEGGCPGDSGGPALDVEGRVLGALSRGHKECMAPIYSATSQFRELLLTAAQRASKLGDYPLPPWAGGPPETTKPRADAGAQSALQASDATDEGQKSARSERRLANESGCALAPSETGHQASLWVWLGAVFAALSTRRARRQFSATASIGTR